MYYHLQTTNAPRALFLRSFTYNKATGAAYVEFTNRKHLAGLFTALDVNLLRGPSGISKVTGPINLLITKHDSGAPVAEVVID